MTSTHSNGLGEIDSIFSQTQLQLSGETIARATLSRTFGKHRVEAGVEGAINTLNQRLALTLNLGGGPFPIPVPNSNLSITERRAEAYVADTWSSWQLDAREPPNRRRIAPLVPGDTDQSVGLAT